MSDVYSFNMRKFNIRSIPADSVVLMIGKRNTGKSWITKEILYNYRDIPFGVAVSPTDHVNPFFSTFMPKGLTVREYRPEIIQQILKRQEKLKKTAGKGYDKRAFLVLDDCLADAKKWKNSSEINTVVLNGRHYGMLFLLTLQYPRGVGPTIRCNADYIIVTRGYSGKNLKIIFEDFVGCFDNYSTFKKVFDSLGPYECLVINNLSQSNKIEDKVFWFKAEERTNFRCCSDAYWNKDISMTRPRNISEYSGSKRNQPTIRVNKLQ
jgi:hypothetical protein